MTTFVDCSGLVELVPTMCYGGEEELRAKLTDQPPPQTAYRPRLGNIAPRVQDWEPRRSNTQTPPLTGANKHQRPMQHQPRAPLFLEPRPRIP